MIVSSRTRIKDPKRARYSYLETRGSVVVVFVEAWGSLPEQSPNERNSRHNKRQLLCICAATLEDLCKRQRCCKRLKAQNKAMNVPRRHYQHVIAMLISSGDSPHLPISVEITDSPNLPWSHAPRSFALLLLVVAHSSTRSCQHAQLMQRYPYVVPTKLHNRLREGHVPGPAGPSTATLHCQRKLTTN